MGKQVDDEQIRKDLYKMCRVIKQYKATGYIMYNDIQTLKKINKVSRWVYIVLTVIIILLGVATLYLDTGYDILMIGGIAISTYLGYNSNKWVISYYLPADSDDEARSRLACELKQLRGPSDIIGRINSYQLLRGEAEQVLKQVEGLDTKEDSSLADTIRWVMELTDYTPEGTLSQKTKRDDVSVKVTYKPI